MEFLTGITPKETMELDMLVRPELAGSKVKVNGFVHAIRAMGDVVFVVLRKRGGLLQCVFEEGV